MQKYEIALFENVVIGLRFGLYGKLLPFPSYSTISTLSPYGFYCNGHLAVTTQHERSPNRRQIERHFAVFIDNGRTRVCAFDVFTVERAQKFSMRTTQLWAYQTRHVSNTGSAVSREETS